MKAAYSTRGRILYTFCPFLSVSYVITGKPTKTLCVTARANDVTEIISYKLHLLNRKFITECILRYFFCYQSTFEDKFVVKQVPVCNFILLIFACVILRKVHVHLLFTLVPECLLFLDSDKQLNQKCSFVSVHPLSETYVKIILFVFISHIVF